MVVGLALEAMISRKVMAPWHRTRKNTMSHRFIAFVKLPQQLLVFTLTSFYIGCLLEYLGL